MLRWARAAQGQQQHRFDGEPADEPVHSCGGSDAWRDLVIARVLIAAGESDAMQLVEAAGRRLSASIERHVAPEFRSAFVARNPPYRELLALARGAA